MTFNRVWAAMRAETCLWCSKNEGEIRHSTEAVRCEHIITHFGLHYLTATPIGRRGHSAHSEWILHKRVQNSTKGRKRAWTRGLPSYLAVSLDYQQWGRLIRNGVRPYCRALWLTLKPVSAVKHSAPSLIRSNWKREVHKWVCAYERKRERARVQRFL